MSFIDTTFSTVANKSEATSVDKKSNQLERIPNAVIKPYSGDWGQVQLLHLLRRCLFGVTQVDFRYFSGLSLPQCLDVLLTQSPTPAPPVNAYNDNKYVDPNVPFGKTWVHSTFGDIEGEADSRRVRMLKAWWVGLMLNQEHSLTEKMTLFWSSHLVAQMFLMKDARFDYDYLALLRLHALGNFKKLTRAITTSPGMLVYLNGNSNSATAPNENYARELQELFTVGKGPDSRYTEDDVKAAARVLTGWEDHQDNLSGVGSLFNPHPSFNPLNHDSGDKQFSAFYDNAVIKGKTGAAGAQETDELIDMIFQRQEVARHVCRKIYRWFVYSEIDSRVEDEVIHPLADIFFNNNFEIKPVLRALFSSEHFFDPMNMGCLIKNPVDFLIGACRQFEVPLPGSSELALQYDSWSLAYQLRLLGMEPGDPLNVAGWPAYHQHPGYHRLWINSNTLPLRNSFTDALSSQSGLSVYSAVLKFDFLSFTRQLPVPEDPNRLIADSALLLSPNPFDITQTAFLKTILLSGQKDDYYWTKAWNAYTANPDDEVNKSIVLTRLRQFYSYIAQRPEYQLI